MPRARRRKFGSSPCVSLAFAMCLLPFALAVAPAAAQQLPASGSTGPSQVSPAGGMPTPDQLEPGVNTSPPTAPAATQGSTTVNESAAAKGSAAAKQSKAAKQSTAAKRSAAAKGSSAAPGSAPAAKAKGGKGANRLELEATEITGNRELPKVLYIVPWKRSDLGELVGRPVNSLLDEVLEPLDRDVFQRENRYYNGLKGAAGPAGAPASPAAETPP